MERFNVEIVPLITNADDGNTHVESVKRQVIKYSKSEDKFSAVRIKIGGALEKVVISQQDSKNQ